MAKLRMTHNSRLWSIIKAKLSDYDLDEMALITKKFRERRDAMKVPRKATKERV